MGSTPNRMLWILGISVAWVLGKRAQARAAFRWRVVGKKLRLDFPWHQRTIRWRRTFFKAATVPCHYRRSEVSRLSLPHFRTSGLFVFLSHRPWSEHQSPSTRHCSIRDVGGCAASPLFVLLCFRRFCLVDGSPGAGEKNGSKRGRVTLEHD